MSPEAVLISLRKNRQKKFSMKKRTGWLLLFLGIGIYMQAGSIRGRIVEGSTRQPMDYVNVALYRKGDDKIFKGTTTNEEGNFRFDDLQEGTYSVNITFIGYSPVELPIHLSAAHPDADLKTIRLSENTKQLQGVEVVGQKSQMRFDVDRKVFNVDQNIAAAGGSASEILQNIPSVDVDTEGNISLRNNSNVVVWINGRPSGLSEDNRAQILEQMPAESIESVEIITNPSAKYSPEGSAGIINLVLKKDRKAGYYGSVAAGANTRGGFNLSGNFNYNMPSFEAYASLGLRRMRFPNESHTERQSWRESEDGTRDTTWLFQDNNGRMRGLGSMLRAGATYHATDKDVLGLTLFGMLGNHKNNSTLLSYDGDRQLTRDRNSDSKSTRKMLEVALDYTREFSEKSNLKLYAGLDVMDGNSDVWYIQRLPQSAQTQTNDDNNKRWEFQADYTNTLDERFKLEAGYKGNLNYRTSDVRTREGLTPDLLTDRFDLDNIFDYKENIQAVYVTFSGKINRWSFQGGLREEYMRYRTETRSETQPIPARVREYWKLYPSLFVSYSLPRENELQVNYTRRVNRPRGRQLNSFRNVTDSTSITYGNPNLDPEFSNSVELNYIKNWSAHMLSVSFYYRNTDGVIQQVRYLDGPTMYNTYENITESQRAGAEIVGKNRLFSFLDLTSTLNLYYYKLDGFTYPYVNNGTPGVIDYDGDKDFSWDLRIMGNMIFPKGFSAQLTGSYRSKQVVAQGKQKASYSLDAGIRKSLLDRKLNIALSGRDLLNSRKRKNISFGDNFYQVSESHFGGPTVSVTVTYLFGKAGNNRKNKRPENNGMDSFENDMMDF